MDAIEQNYAAARAVQRAINPRIVQTLSRNALEQTARRLGMWHRGTIVVDDQAARDRLLDSSLYDYFTGGMNAVERFARRRPFGAESLEARVLDSMVGARFTMIEIEEPIPDVGAHAFDHYFGRDVVLADRGLGASVEPGMFLVTRLLDLDDYVMTTGVPLLFHEEIADVLARVHERAPHSITMSSKGRAELATTLLHMATVDASEAAKYLLRIADRAEVAAAKHGAAAKRGA